MYGYMSEEFRPSNFCDGYEFLFVKREYHTPRDYPYSFDPYWLWHDDLEDLDNWSSEYSDRITGYSANYRARYFEASSKIGKNFVQWNKKETQSVINAVYGNKYIVRGLARGCNVSNGYDYAIIFLKERPEKHE